MDQKDNLHKDLIHLVVACKYAELFLCKDV